MDEMMELKEKLKIHFSFIWSDTSTLMNLKTKRHIP